jgi:hypothetical protein
MGDGWLTPCPGRLTLGKKTRHLLYRRLGGPEGRCGQSAGSLVLTVFEPRTVQPVASRYTDWAVPAHVMPISEPFWEFNAADRSCAALVRSVEFVIFTLWHPVQIYKIHWNRPSVTTKTNYRCQNSTQLTTDFGQTGHLQAIGTMYKLPETKLTAQGITKRNDTSFVQQLWHISLFCTINLYAL